MPRRRSPTITRRKPTSIVSLRPCTVPTWSDGGRGQRTRALQRRRDALYQQIVEQVTREGARIAKERGFSVVLDRLAGAAGGYDLTNDLIKDVESLHE